MVKPDGPKNSAERPDVLAFSRDGKFLAVNKNRSVLIYDVSSRQVVQTINAVPDAFISIGSLAFNPDASLIAVGLPGFAERRRRPDGTFEDVPQGPRARVQR
jgi:hypothetical protein